MRAQVVLPLKGEKMSIWDLGVNKIYILRARVFRKSSIYQRLYICYYDLLHNRLFNLKF